MEPSIKSEGMNNFLDKVFNRTNSIKNNICVCCKSKLGPFKDKLSEREATISGLCQKCQDGIWL